MDAHVPRGEEHQRQKESRSMFIKAWNKVPYSGTEKQFPIFKGESKMEELNFYEE